jgi:ATP-binding cassette subfamily B protein
LRLAVLEGEVPPDALVAPRGVRLSGGQLQRAAAARALVAEPELLVVDDLSSALDVETERSLWERLRGLTCLAASSRPAAWEMADRILVVDDGRLVAAGPVTELPTGVRRAFLHHD